MELVNSITEVFEALSNWLVSAITSVLPIFYDSTENTLTLLGVMCVISVGIGIFFLVLGLIQRFFSFGA